MESKFFRNFTFFILSHAMFLCIGQNAGQGAQALSDSLPEKKEQMVRVLLAESEGDKRWVIIAPDGATFFFRLGDTVKKARTKATQIIIEIINKAMYINGILVHADAVEVVSNKSRLVFNEIEYQGTFIVYVRNSASLLINKLSLEKYLYSVLNSESWPGWPLEVNKAFAIASRSYVIAKIMERRARNGLYDVKNYNIHQTYRGFHKTRMFKQAVKETDGLVLVYDVHGKKKPILAMFDSCCGGIIPAHMQGIDFERAPYLARTKRCTFCKQSKLYRWKLEMEVHEFEKVLREQGMPVGRVADITISKKDKAGVVHEVAVHGREGSLKIAGKKLYSWFKPLKSYCFSVSKRYKKVKMEGWGYGHHLGMCQWGARSMVDEGFTYSEILNFYYPHTQLKRLRIV